MNNFFKKTIKNTKKTEKINKNEKNKKTKTETTVDIEEVITKSKTNSCWKQTKKCGKLALKPIRIAIRGVVNLFIRKIQNTNYVISESETEELVNREKPENDVSTNSTKESITDPKYQRENRDKYSND